MPELAVLAREATDHFCDTIISTICAVSPDRHQDPAPKQKAVRQIRPAGVLGCVFD
jgi:hypothetical protein